MDLLPNRDTVAAFEARLGPGLMSVLIWLLATALAIGSIGIIFAGLRAVFNPLRPWLPGLGSNTSLIVLQWAATILPILFGALISWRLQQIQRNYQEFKTKVSDFNVAVINSGQNVESRVDEALTKLTDVDERLRYIEEKVGDKLTDVLVERELRQPDVRRRKPGS
jgi:hypothetical protein